MFKPRKQRRGGANKSNIWAEHSECVGRDIETESSGADKKSEQQTAGGDDKGVGEEDEERIFTVPSHRGAFHYCQTVRPGWHNGIRFCNKQRVGGPAKKGSEDGKRSECQVATVQTTWPPADPSVATLSPANHGSQGRYI